MTPPRTPSRPGPSKPAPSAQPPDPGDLAALHSGAHNAAMRLAKSGGIGDNAFGVTSIWKPEVLNGIFRAAKAKSGDLAELTGQWL